MTRTREVRVARRPV